MPLITVLPSNQSFNAPIGGNLMKALKDAGHDIATQCGGHATCCECIVKITEGADHLNSPPFEEVRLLGNVFHITKERLSCQTMVLGDITVDLSVHQNPELKAQEAAKKSARQSARQQASAKKILIRKSLTDEEKQKKVLDAKLQEQQEQLRQSEAAAQNAQGKGPHKPTGRGGHKRPKGYKDKL